MNRSTFLFRVVVIIVGALGGFVGFSVLGAAFATAVSRVPASTPETLAFLGVLGLVGGLMIGFGGWYVTGRWAVWVWRRWVSPADAD